MTVAVRFGGEVGSEGGFDGVDSRRGAGDRRKVTEMASSECNDHEPFVVAGDEIDSVRAVDGVPAGLATATVHLYFGEVAEGSRGGQCDVFEWQRDLRAVSGRVTLAHSGSDRQGGVEPARDVPGRQGVIDNSGVVRGAGDLWESQRGVDRVVDPRGCRRGVREPRG